jgi:calcineurin-like phosphoesterase family protein
MIYFTADTHFCHFNIIKYCARPFSTIEEMHDILINNWNFCVKNSDEIYILGDFLFKGNGIDANNVLKRLNGKKYLIKGNHDKFLDDKSFDQNNFEWVKDYYVLKNNQKKYVLFHYPIFEWDGYFNDQIHLYGHVHNCGNNLERYERFKILGKKAINVGVDLHNFSPLSIETINKMIE